MLEAVKLTLVKENKALIDTISTTLRSGSVTALVGQNGSGKSTFLKTLSGIWHPTSGTVLWNNEPLLAKEREEISRIIHLVPQNSTIPFNYTGRELVAMGRYSRREKTECKQAIDNALERTEAFSFAGKKYGELSGGQRQRILIARALAAETEVILLDEPATHLDIAHELMLWNLLKELAKEGKTIVAAHHDLAGVFHHFDNALLFHEGRCVASGEIHEVLTNERIKSIFGVERRESRFCLT